MLGPVKSYLNETGISISDFPLKPAVMASLIAIVEEGRVHFSTASSKIFPELVSGNSHRSAATGNQPEPDSDR